jgi:hypothetical protein
LLSITHVIRDLSIDPILICRFAERVSFPSLPC